MRVFAAGILSLIVLAAPDVARAWGMDVHRWLTRRALDQLPAEIQPLFAVQKDKDFVVEHAADPDLWRTVDLRGQLGPEDPNHFLDIDDLGEPAPFTGVPRDWDAYLARYGQEKVTRAGRLPWRTEEVYKKLVTAFRDIGRGTAPYAADNARYLTAVISHYIEDGHQPFHAVANYDGQLTNQRGIHSRFETELVLRNLSTLSVGPAVIKPIPDIRTFMFETVVESQGLVAGVLDADRQAIVGRELYDDGYYAALLAGARTTLEKRLTDSVGGVVSVIVAAWTEAGKPAMPVNSARPPARIIRH
jgi:hypothetical protein